MKIKFSNECQVLSILSGTYLKFTKVLPRSWFIMFSETDFCKDYKWWIHNYLNVHLKDIYFFNIKITHVPCFKKNVVPRILQVSLSRGTHYYIFVCIYQEMQKYILNNLFLSNLLGLHSNLILDLYSFSILIWLLISRCYLFAQMLSVFKFQRNILFCVAIKRKTNIYSKQQSQEEKYTNIVK